MLVSLSHDINSQSNPRQTKMFKHVHTMDIFCAIRNHTWLQHYAPGFSSDLYKSGIHLCSYKSV